MSIVNIITNHTNGAGLQKDSLLLAKFIEERGHTVRKVMHTCEAAKRQSREYRADVNFFLELAPPGMLQNAKINVLVPNSEWWCDKTWGHLLYPRMRFNVVLCKTLDAFRIWGHKVGKGPCRFIGWEANDYYDPSIPREVSFWHACGKSETKNTAAVVEAWEKHRLPYRLDISAFKECIVAFCKNKEAKNIYWKERWPEGAMPQQMNSHLFHLMPSKYEGYGMAINEGLGCGAVILTTNAPPMNQFSGIPQALTIRVNKVQPVRAAQFNLVDVDDIARAAHQAANMPTEELQRLSIEARQGYLKDRLYFRAALPKVLEELGL